ncbi:L,D-transpeptidase family protein [Paenibacillus sp. 1P07SE]|uniref:L,D-transpeptidase family protein n=1 Tax=Paenibacillus sp. 1P07SE TaxID=3132209 RepID=UPI0039A52975
MRKQLRAGMIMMLAAVLVTMTAWTGTADANTNRISSSQDQLIVVNKKTNKLAFFEGGKLVQEYTVATGLTPDLTPEGKFKIVNKIKNRPYYKEGIKGGDPTNPLGDRWIGLDVNGTKGTTYAIHGNNNERSIGKYVSAGCIRMHNKSIHELFEKVKVNSYAVVTTSSLSFEEIARNNGYDVGPQKYNGKIVINGTEQKLTQSMIMSDQRIFVPMRDLFQLLGATVQWDNTTKTVTAYSRGLVLVHKPLTGSATVNGSSVSINTSMMHNGSVMLPLRDISTLSQFDVHWESKNNTVYLTSKATATSK